MTVTFFWASVFFWLPAGSEALISSGATIDEPRGFLQLRLGTTGGSQLTGHFVLSGRPLEAVRLWGGVHKTWGQRPTSGLRLAANLASHLGNLDIIYRRVVFLRSRDTYEARLYGPKRGPFVKMQYVRRERRPDGWLLVVRGVGRRGPWRGGGSMNKSWGGKQTISGRVWASLTGESITLHVGLEHLVAGDKTLAVILAPRLGAWHVRVLSRMPLRATQPSSSLLALETPRGRAGQARLTTTFNTLARPARLRLCAQWRWGPPSVRVGAFAAWQPRSTCAKEVLRVGLHARMNLGRGLVDKS